VLTAIPVPSPLDVAFVVGAIVLIHVARRWIWLYALLVLPGTFLHELAHWLVGVLLGARPTRLRLVPVRCGPRRWSLAAVGFRRVNWINALPIALAPLLLAPLAWFGYRFALGQPDNHWAHWVGLYVATVAAWSCLPSRADLRLALSRPGGVLFYALLLALALAAVGWRASG
jgi:hypothetical protein